MTANRTTIATREELADLLDDAAQRISATYPTPPTRSYLHSVLGALSTGPEVIAELSDRPSSRSRCPPLPPACSPWPPTPPHSAG